MSVILKINKYDLYTLWGFPGGPVAKTLLPCFYCKKSRFNPCLGTKISLAVHGVAETNKNKNTSLIRLGLHKNKDIIN